MLQPARSIQALYCPHCDATACNIHTPTHVPPSTPATVSGCIELVEEFKPARIFCRAAMSAYPGEMCPLIKPKPQSEQLQTATFAMGACGGGNGLD